VLGPLHYLTQISWMHDRQFFSPHRFDFAPLALLCLLIFLGQKKVLGDYTVDAIIPWTTDLAFVAFALGLLIVLAKDLKPRLVGSVAILALAVLLHCDGCDGSHPTVAIFSIYLPTLIHVYVFTGAFILYGALKSRSTSGHVSFWVFLACSVGFLLSGDTALGYLPSAKVQNDYLHFIGIHRLLDRHVGPGRAEQYRYLGQFFSDPFAVKMIRFIAFAYTYHFLNWFSKTSVIRWHEVGRRRFVGVIALWLASVGLYAYDFDVGFRWLVGLSLLHVFLEFPLDHQTFIGIGREIRSRLAAPA
jgi:hypothetical protein